jgi:dTDP-4-dehydrorhamnose reductase
MRADGPILLTGGAGQIGGALRSLAAAYGTEIVAPDRNQLDLRDLTAISRFVADGPWSLVINSAAYTAVDKAESEPELAFRINADAPAALARAAADKGIGIVHVSTDYVFDGTKNDPYIETDPVAPLGVYGKSKALGEASVISAGGSHAIVRTAWIVSSGGGNFLNSMIRLAREKSELRVVNDQLGCPTNAGDVAKALLAIGMQLKGRQGIWHCVNSGEASWHQLARFIFDYLDRQGIATPRLVAIPTTEYPTPAQRPANSRLCTDKLEREFNITMRPWQDAIGDILDQRRNMGNL